MTEEELRKLRNIMKQKKKFYVPEQQECLDDARTLEDKKCGVGMEEDEFAEEAAEHVWHNEDGWEWMRDGASIVVVMEDGREMQFKIDVWFAPSFSAFEK